MYKIFFMFIFSGAFLFAAEETSSSLTKQRIEVMELKKELNNFYNEKEKEYQRQKKELEDILTKIEQEKAEIKRLYEKNDEILKEIRSEVVKKSIRVFELMKAKNAADIFNQMIGEGKIEDVFDIMIKLKENNVTQIMKFLSVTKLPLI